MIGEFFRRLVSGETNDTPRTEDDARLALAVVLVRIARSNWDYAAEEAQRIELILSRRYAMSAAEVAELRSEAEEVEAHATDTVQFTRAIKAAVPLEEREEVMEALWEMVLADGVRDHEEEGILRLVAPLLGINDRDSALARQRVEARLATG